MGSDDRTAPKQVLGHVTALVDHSLLGREPVEIGDPVPAPGDAAPVRLDRLDESGLAVDARHAHADFYRRVADKAAPHLIGPDEVRSQSRLEVEEPNFDVALRWAADHDPEMALRLGVALWPYWSLRWNERRGVAYISAILDGSGLDVPEDLLAGALTAAGDMASNPGDARRGVPWATDAVAAFRRLGDEHGLSLALLALGSALGNRGALDEADLALVEALDIARRRGDDLLAARAFDRTFHVASPPGQP